MHDSNDFAHHKTGVARLNHGSFGACPAPVLAQQQQTREQSLAQPDEFYFSGELDAQMRRASDSVIPLLGSPDIQPEQVCLVENATVATVTLARRWAKKISPGDTIMVPSIAYRACINILHEYCEHAGATIEIVPIPFPANSTEQIISGMRESLQALAASGKAPRFAFIDHISSQPAILLPVAEIVALCREYGTEDIEIAVDGAHAVGSVPVGFQQTGADWFFSNLHKWGFAPSTATVLVAASTELMRDTGHPITSWKWQQGLHEEARFTGTRDYSAMLAVPAAMAYLQSWRSDYDECTHEYCHRRVMEAASDLAAAWNTPMATPAELVATQYMVQLPEKLVVADLPGQPGAGIRATLRDQYDIEAAIGNFGERGNYVRLSYAVYNTQNDIDRLAEAVLKILHQQSA